MVRFALSAYVDVNTKDPSLTSKKILSRDGKISFSETLFTTKTSIVLAVRESGRQISFRGF